MSIVLENYLNTREAAAVIGCDERTVRRMLQEGTLSGKKVSPRSWMVPRSEAERVAATTAPTGRPRGGGRK